VSVPLLLLLLFITGWCGAAVRNACI